MTALASMKPVKFVQSIDTAFPPVDSGHIPLGSLVLVQIKQPVTRTEAGLELTESDKATEGDNTQVAKVIAMGPGAFKSRTDLSDWPEGAWVKTGDYVRVPKYGGDRWNVQNGKDPVTFALFEDLLMKAIVKDPLAARAFF